MALKMPLKKQKKVEEGTEGSKKGRIGKKKLLILAATAFVLAGGAAAFFVPRYLKQKRQEELEKAPAYYFSKDDGVSSVTEIVGEREFESIDAKLLEGLVAEAAMNAPPEEEKAEAEDSEGENPGETEAEGTEEKAGEAEAEETGEKAEEAAELPGTEAYQYRGAEDVQADIDAYLTYLETEKGFVDVTSVMDAREAQQTAADAETETEEEEEGPIHYHLTGAGADPQTSLLLAVVQYEDFYQIIACASAQPWSQYVASLWEEREVQAEQKGSVQKDDAMTRLSLEEKLTSMTKEQLGLEEATENYEFISGMGTIFVEGSEYFHATAYRHNDVGTLDYVGTYLIDADGNVCYKYNEVTGETEPIN